MDENKLIEDIERYGWCVLKINSTDYLPSFAYTVGLWKNYGHPEIICFGLSTELLHLVLNDVGDLIKKRGPIQVNRNYDDIFDNSLAVFLEVDQSYIKNYLGYSQWYNDYKDFPAIQLVWTDRNNNFPWEENYEAEFEYKQPLLDRNIDFKFRESKNLGIFTTRQWLDLDKPILHVVHDEDGDWQFLTGDQLLTDARLVALHQIVLKDNSINEIFDLDYGEEARRDYIGGQWVRSKSETIEDEDE